MPQLFIAILVAFGFWSRQSKDQKIRTSNASWLRTSVYFVLLVMVGVFYYKSNQIPVITHEVQIYGIKQAVDSNKAIVQDKASLQIVSRFDNNSIFKHLFAYTKPKDSIGYVKTQDYGGVAVKLSLYNDSATSFKFNVNENNEFYYDNNPLNEDMYNHYYAVSIVSSRISSISPFQPYLKMYSLKDIIDMRGIINNDTIPAYYYNAAISSMNEAQKESVFKDPAIYDYYDRNAICSIQYLWTKKNNHIEVNDVFLPIKSNVLNSMNFFSAADLSQCTYVVPVMSECPLEEIYFNFDVPVEMLPSKYKPTQLDAYDICFRDSAMLKQIRNHVMFLHVKMPTMQNLQLVRSLILTTLLTALIALFSSNLYYSLRRSIKKCKRNRCKSRLNFSFLRRIKKHWEKSLHRTIYLILLLLLLLTVQRCSNYYILIDSAKFDMFNYAIIFLFIVVVIYYIILFYRIKKGKYSAKKENTGDIDNSDMMKYLVEKNIQEQQEDERIYSEHIKDYGDSIMMEETEGDDNDEENNKENDNTNSI